jgi:hypothetical protein
MCSLFGVKIPNTAIPCGTMAHKKSPLHFCKGLRKRRLPTLPLGIAVPSAQTVLTSLFGMVRGGPRRHGHLNFCPGPKGDRRNILKRSRAPTLAPRTGFDIIMGQVLYRKEGNTRSALGAFGGASARISKKVGGPSRGRAARCASLTGN